MGGGRYGNKAIVYLIAEVLCAFVVVVAVHRSVHASYAR